MLKFKVSRRLYPLMMVWAVLQSFWPASLSASCRQFRSFFLRLLLFSSLLFGWYVLCWRCECLQPLCLTHLFCLLLFLKDFISIAWILLFFSVIQITAPSINKQTFQYWGGYIFYMTYNCSVIANDACFGLWALLADYRGLNMEAATYEPLHTRNARWLGGGWREGTSQGKSVKHVSCPGGNFVSLSLSYKLDSGGHRAKRCSYSSQCAGLVVSYPAFCVVGTSCSIRAKQPLHESEHSAASSAEISN
jgi:hypothetical protein